jgi:hypothetical protein
VFADAPGIALPYSSPKSIGGGGGAPPVAFRRYECKETFVTWLLARYEHNGVEHLQYLRHYVWEIGQPRPRRGGREQRRRGGPV